MIYIVQAYGYNSDIDIPPHIYQLFASTNRAIAETILKELRDLLKLKREYQSLYYVKCTGEDELSADDISLAKSLDNNLPESLKKYKDIGKIINTYYAGVVLKKGIYYENFDWHDINFLLIEMSLVDSISEAENLIIKEINFKNLKEII